MHNVYVFAVLKPLVARHFDTMIGSAQIYGIAFFVRQRRFFAVPQCNYLVAPRYDILRGFKIGVPAVLNSLAHKLPAPEGDSFQVRPVR